MSSKISLADALDTLASMFPDYERDTLKQTLYKTGGHMERTVENLLAMQQSQMVNGNRNKSQIPRTPPPAYYTQLKHNLSPSFLVYDLNEISSSSEYSMGSQEMRDEQYARELQKQLFMEQNINRRGNAGVQPQRRTENDPTKREFTPQLVTGSQSIREPMRGFGVNNRPVQSNWSDLARRKFAEFKSKFTRSEPNKAQSNKERQEFLDEEDNEGEF
jgi:hypothetical protein